MATEGLASNLKEGAGGTPMKCLSILTSEASFPLITGLPDTRVIARPHQLAI